MLFELDKKWTGEAELRIEDSLVQSDREGKVRLVPSAQGASLR